MNPNIYFDVDVLESSMQWFVDNVMTLFWWTLGPISILAIIYMIVKLVHR